MTASPSTVETAETTTVPAVELVDVTCSFGSVRAVDQVSLTIASGEFFTLLGPSGSGKTTAMRLVAGLARPDGGTIRIAGADVSGVPPWKRNVGMVFQDYALFPHLDVTGNIAYGMKMQRRPASYIRSEVERLLDVVKLPGFGPRSVTTLSGGQRQRVALARALASGPAVLLLDEPLAALDEKVRREMQLELRRIQQETETTFLYVTHDQEEALTMSDRVAVFRDGACVQCDVPATLFEHPRTRFIASFFRGFNVLRLPHRLLPEGTTGLPGGAATDGSSEVAIRAERVVLGASSSADALSLPGQVRQVTYRGAVTDHIVVLDDDQTVVATAGRAEAAPGDRVDVTLPAADLVHLEVE
ncbi:ABC transporter ATP-binding protein [Nocardioides sp. LHG3406-4]|uniref:ABC transporter ATP-binding protein n=1 Tax=Nocardioides sp. LHG3406-4 TaxID=2804575 RepID=UPI003CEDA73B